MGAIAHPVTTYEGVQSDEKAHVCVQIEELNIADLKEGLAGMTHNDIQTVYQNLLRVAQNHLRASFGRPYPSFLWNYSSSPKWTSFQKGRRE